VAFRVWIEYGISVVIAPRFLDLSDSPYRGLPLSGG